MISIKSILVRYLAVVVALLLAVFALLFHPALASVKASASEALNVTETRFALILCIILGLSYVLVAWRLVSLISGTILDLVKRAESNVLSVSVGPKAPLMEANRLGFVIESKMARIRELESLLDDAETNLETRDRELKDMARSGNSLKEGELVSVEIETLQTEVKELNALNAELKTALEAERSNRGNVSESKGVLRNAESLLRLVGVIRDPSFVIKDVSSELQSRWEELSFTRIRDDLAEIHRQSEIQTEAINKAKVIELR